MAWVEAYLLTKWHLDPSSHLATIDMGRKLGAASTNKKLWLILSKDDLNFS